ncbi:MAG: hypothetical protein H6828_10190 [Planctomycetes bacterium]|nr:hypothetical protein [Planctomycetota bacterium]
MSRPSASPERAVREELLAPLRRVLAWLLALRDGEGRILCPQHRVEHTGKSAGAIVLCLELARHDPQADRAALVAAAVQQGRRLVANLVREGTSPCHTFRPGRHDPFNCSNSVIDGGACSDALAQLVQDLGDELDEADRAAFAHASVLHAKTYLRYAVLDKGIPAQRAWGLTGLAAAWRLARVDDAETARELERAALEAVGMLEGIQHRDGSYPYHPAEWGAAHPGAGDVSAFYQSRVTAFLLYALGALDRDPMGEVFRGPLLRGLDFLAALVGPDGVKCGLVEAKPWYWGATYEVASHPFDVYALARGFALTGRTGLAHAALRSFRAWAAHLDADGAPRSHLPGPGRRASYQCPVFWAGHAMWMARALRDLEACAARPEPPPSTGGNLTVGLVHFPDASLVRLEDDAVVAWIRGARPPYNVAHGSPHGGGLLRVVRKRDGAELLPRCRLGGEQQGEWTGHAGVVAPLRGWRAGAEELRFSGWLARVAWRAGERGAALRAPFAMLKRGVLAFAHTRVSSAFGATAELELLPDGVRLVVPLAHRGGAEVGARVERVFQVDGEGLCVRERVLAAGGVRGLRFRLPAAAVDAGGGPRDPHYRLA